MKLHVGAHTSRVDHWDRHSVYRDCSFPGSIVLGVWGIPWFHSIRYKKKKKKKNVFEKFANRTEEVQSLFDWCAFFYQREKKFVLVAICRFKRMLYRYIFSPPFFTSCFRHCCETFAGFLQQELSIFY